MAKNVTVTLKEYTYYQGRQLKPGDEIQIDTKTAERWAAVGITGEFVRTEAEALEDKKVSELKRLAKAAKIEGYNDMDKKTLVQELTALYENPETPGDAVAVEEATTEAEPAETGKEDK